MAKRMKSVFVYTCDTCGNDEFQTREKAEVYGPVPGLHISSITWVTYSGDRTATKFYICQDCVYTQVIDIESVLIKATTPVIPKEEKTEDTDDEVVDEEFELEEI